MVEQLSDGGCQVLSYFIKKGKLTSRYDGIIVIKKRHRYVLLKSTKNSRIFRKIPLLIYDKTISIIRKTDGESMIKRAFNSEKAESVA